jgi:hypothetical protein
MVLKLFILQSELFIILYISLDIWENIGSIYVKNGKCDYSISRIKKFPKEEKTTFSFRNDCISQYKIISLT